MEIVQVGPERLGEYASISIAFLVETKLILEGALTTSGPYPERPVSCSYWKDYDECLEDHPTSLPSRWDMTHWAIFIAMDSEKPVGGAIVARDTPALEMLESRKDLALVMDIRVAPDWRGKQVGRVLFEEAGRWAKDHECTEIRVETQDVNVPACRFYEAMGCRLFLVDGKGYPDNDEAKLIWAKPL